MSLPAPLQAERPDCAAERGADIAARSPRAQRSQNQTCHSVKFHNPFSLNAPAERHHSDRA